MYFTRKLKLNVCPLISVVGSYSIYYYTCVYCFKDLDFDIHIKPEEQDRILYLLLHFETPQFSVLVLCKNK